MDQSMAMRELLKQRLAFMGLDERARDTMRKLQPLLSRAIGPAMDAFYSKLRATPETKRFFRDDAHIAGARGRQERHWAIIAAGNYTEDYVSGVRKIGEAHARIGLSPQWYIGGYALIIEQLIHGFLKEQRPRLSLTGSGQQSIAESLSCIVKAALLDMDFAISVYLETLEDKRRLAEESGQVALQQERAVVANSIGVGLSKMAAKDLTVRLSGEVPEAYRALQTDFNAAVSQLAEAMEGVSGSTHIIHSGTQDIAASSDDLSRRTEQQAASLQETAAALGEITATVKKSAEGAAHASEVVAAAKDDAEKSGIIVGKAVEAMNAIAESSQQISQIIVVIDEIAFQTNLLALNAGVEAARAGEVGRGFAVVASEVRALAQRSAEAAKEIKSLISKSSTQVAQGVELVAETGRALERIVGQVKEINGVVAGIAAGAREQSSGLSEINTAINQMDQATQQNAAMVEESTASIHSLSQETDQLAGLVGQFHVAEAAPGRKRRAMAH